MTETWRSLALCREFSALPWIEQACGRTEAATCAMKAVCSACPVLADCAAYADRRGLTAGFWAGRERTEADAIGGEAA
jgi:Transcription factor WhiB